MIELCDFFPNKDLNHMITMGVGNFFDPITSITVTTPIMVAISWGVKSESRDYANYGGDFFPKKRDPNHVITKGQRIFLTQLRQLQ